MAATEFSLISRFFARTGADRADVELGVGDDAALLMPPPGHDVAVAISTLAEGTHFAPGTPPTLVAHRGFTTAINHLAASAAEPAWLTLALSMTEVDEGWLEAFSRRLDALAKGFGVQLVGGDTTAGALHVTLHAHGFVPARQASGPNFIRPGDLVYVTGTLGNARLAALARQKQWSLSDEVRHRLEARLQQPEPRVAEGLALRGLASGGVSVSDGLAGCLSRLLEAAGIGATLVAESLPLSTVLADNLEAAGGWLLPLTAAGDFELCFTVPPDRRTDLERRFADLPAGCTCIGKVEGNRGLRCLLSDGTDLSSIQQ